MARQGKPESLGDAIRVAVVQSGLSYNRLAVLARVSQGQLSRYMSGDRDLTLAVASRLCRVLGLGLVRVGPVMSEPLADPTPSTRRRRKEGEPPPETAYVRGQGRRVDLEGEREPGEGRPGQGGTRRRAAGPAEGPERPQGQGGRGGGGGEKARRGRRREAGHGSHEETKPKKHFS